MATARVQMTWLRDNGLTEDVVSNTWYVADGSPDPVPSADVDDIAAAFDNFYDDLVAYYAAYMNGVRTFKIYDMADSEPRVPMYDNGLVASTVSNEGLPAQLAACLSFSAQASSGVSQRRRRGRIFLGPLAQATLDAGGGTGDRRISSSTLTAIDGAYSGLVTDLDAIGTGWYHAVYSPTIDAGDSLSAATAPVAEVYVDNRYDVIRSRASTTTTRQIILP